MIDSEQQKRIQEILADLAELDAKDRQFAQHRSGKPTDPLVSIPITELFKSGERAERRQILHQELRDMVR